MQFIGTGSYDAVLPCTAFEPFRVFKISTISRFVFNGNSCPVRLIKYLKHKTTYMFIFHSCIYRRRVHVCASPPSLLPQ